MSAAKEVAVGPASWEPKYSRFSQQQMAACRPVLTPKAVVAIYLSLGCFFIPIGAKCLLTTNGVSEVVQRYDNLCATQFNRSTGVPRGVCSVTMPILKKDMAPPIYVYYGIDNMYLNHRRMVLSRSDYQLRGDTYYASQSLATCEPMRFARQYNQTTGVTYINTSATIFPCGLAAWSFFNDSYVIQRYGDAAPLVVNATGIAFSVDRNKRFGSGLLPQNFNMVPQTRGGGALPAPHSLLSDPMNERFVVWMRTPALSNFRKLWGRIDGNGLRAGDEVIVNVTNQWNSYDFGGKKYIVLSTSSWLGGANNFIGVAYIVIGVLCFALGLLYAAVAVLKGRALGDPRYLSWNKEE